MSDLKMEIDWLSEDPAFSVKAIEGGLTSEDYLYFIRAIRLELLDHIHALAEGPQTTKTQFLFELSKLKREWEVKRW